MPKYAALNSSQRYTMNSIIERLKDLFAGDSQAEISEKTGLVRSKISKILNYSEDDETGQLVHVPDLVAIADAYGVSLSSLVERPSDSLCNDVSLYDAAKAFITLNKLLGLNVREPETGTRPVVTFDYSALNDFLYFVKDAYKYIDTESAKASDRAKSRALSSAIDAKLRELKEYDAFIFSEAGASEGFKRLPSYVEYFGDNLLNYKNAPEDVKKDMRAILGGSAAPQLLSYLYNARRNNDGADICKIYGIDTSSPDCITAAAQKIDSLITSITDLLDDLPADRKDATSEQFARLFAE